MAIALVGSAGAIAQSSTTTISPTFGQVTTAGNFLILQITGDPNYTAPSGWTPVFSPISSNGQVYYKANCAASETAPTLTTTTISPNWYARLTEWSGISNTSPVDKSTNGNVSLGAQGSMSGADAVSGDLVMWSWDVGGNSKSATCTISVTFGPTGGTTVATANTGATKGTEWAYFGGYITASAGTDVSTATWTPSSGTISGGPGFAAVSFKAAVPTAPAAPTGVAASQAASGGPVTVTWTDETTGSPTSTYNILRSTDNISFSQIASGISQGTQTYSDKSSLRAITYWYEVQATNASGTATSTSASVAVHEIYPVPNVVGQAVNRTAVF